jgi:putative ABC transport system permease protein
LKRLDFYFKYAARSVRRGGQRSFFAILCVAVGVAALVALQSLAVSIKDTLIGDIQARAGGDVIATASSSPTDSLNLTGSDQQFLARLKSDGSITDYTVLSKNSFQIKGYFSFPPTLYAIEPDKFPLYGKVEMLQPSGGDLRQLLSEPNTIVISKNLWEKNDYKLGQEIDVAAFSTDADTAGKSARVKIVGEVSPDMPGLTIDAGLVFGFGIASRSTADSFLASTTSQDLSVYLKSPPGADNDGVAAQLENYPAHDSSGQIYFGSSFSNVTTALKLQQTLADNLVYVEDLLSYVGLLAILIGGIGVVNTMLVVIGRRTTEIATVKALGLKTRQTLTIFTLEALMLGVMGSVLGVVLGVALGYGVKGVAEGLFFRPLNWGIYPQPILIGLLVGTVTAGVFGFLPAYAAGKVRPAVVLRQQSSVLPRIGGLASIGLLLLMTFALGLVAGLLLHNLILGVIVSFITMLVCLLMTALMYLVVFLTGKLPAPFGPSFKMALRSFSRHRGRTATTLLVMAIGLFFISFIVIIADSIKTSFRETFDLNLGFNVIALNLVGGQTPQIQSNLEQNTPGVKQVFASTNGRATINSINGKSFDSSSFSSRISLSGRSLARGASVSPNGPVRLVSGRDFTPADMDKPVLLVYQDEAAKYGLKVGDKVNLSISGSNLTSGQLGPGTRTVRDSSQKTGDFEIIGIITPVSSTIQFERGWVAPYNIVSAAGGSFSILYMLVDRAQIKTTLNQVQAQLLGGFVFDLGDLINTFSKILDQILAFPLLLSLLSLFSGAILIANNVALAMLERRTEIGVLKAIGAKRRRVLSMLIWESSLVGLLGGIIGVGTGIVLALLIPVVVNATSRGSRAAIISITWSPLTAVLLLALGAGLAIAATLVSAWGAVQEKPLVVLRYE